jgi:hypothetical protein
VSDVREKLAKELMPAEWKMLAMHHRRDALFVVDGRVPLLDVAVAVAEDRTEAVKAWIEGGQIARPTPEQVQGWEAESGARFVSAIVQPFVLAQRLDDFGPAPKA